MVFKRFKSLVQLGSLPKYHEDSPKAWLYGKLLAALLVEKLISHASSISPWAMTWDSRRPKSPWREFSFAWNEVRRAIDPGIGLTKTVSDWENISKELREAPRKRSPQLARHFPDAR